MSNKSKNDALIAQAAARLRWGVIVVLMLMILTYAAGRSGWQVGTAHIEYHEHPGAPEWSRPVGDGTMLLLLIALVQLVRMLGRIAAGDFFSVAVTRSFRRFALWLLLMAIWALAMPIVLTSIGSNGVHQVRLLIDFRQVLTLGITLLLFLLARLLEHARRLDEENREFV